MLQRNTWKIFYKPIGTYIRLMLGVKASRSSGTLRITLYSASLK